MLIEFLGHLRKHRVPVSIREWLDLLAALRAGLVFAKIDEFYFLSRLCLVKDEKYFDRFDQAFAAYFDQMDDWQSALAESPVQALMATALSDLFDPQIHQQWRELLDDYQARVAQQRLEEIRLQIASQNGDSDPGKVQAEAVIVSDAREHEDPESGHAAAESPGEGEVEGEGEGEGEDEGACL